MKFTLVTKDILGRRYTDEYNEPSVTTPEEAETWCQNQVDTFNTYYPKSRRQFVNFWIQEKAVPRPVIAEQKVVENDEHIWEKVNPEPLVTPKGRKYDILLCKRCGITARRYLDTSEIKRDAKYTKKMYENCNWKNL